MPRERERLNSTMVLSVMPSKKKAVKVMRKEMGMASATKKPLERPMKMNTIPKTRTSPLKMLFTSSSTLALISID